MDKQSYAVVVTTINSPTRAVHEIQDRSALLQARFYLIGDTKSPTDFTLEGAHYFDVDAQKEMEFKFAKICPTRHYARKNIGYLAAMKDGAKVIIETDDDNIPREGFWRPRIREVTAPLVSKPGWCNVYRYFSDKLIWPRGLPLDRILDMPDTLSGLASTAADCPIQQGLADGNPDVDAIYRLILPLPVDFDDGTVILDKGVWCPFNSQNTTFWRVAFPLLYLPFYCSFRMTDIWRSFVAQRILWENNWRLMFHGSTVFQERNEHDLMRDFAEEVPGYLNNEAIKKTLEDLALKGGVAHLGDDLSKCYRALIKLGVVGPEEEGLLAAWNEDVALHGQ